MLSTLTYAKRQTLVASGREVIHYVFQLNSQSALSFSPILLADNANHVSLMKFCRFVLKRTESI